jgi:hypothetical protein
MTDKAISPLRQRMIEDMTIRKLAPKTQRDYVQRVKHFAAFLGRSPDTASFEDVRRYELALLMPLGASHKLTAFRNGATLIGVLALPECSAAKWCLPSWAFAALDACTASVI